MIDVENGEHQSSNTFLAHLYLSSNIPVKMLNTNLQTTSLGTLSCVQELVSTTTRLAGTESCHCLTCGNIACSCKGASPLEGTERHPNGCNARVISKLQRRVPACGD